jgi:hypothetical protein
MEKIDTELNKGTVVIAGFPGVGKSYLKSIGEDKVVDINYNFDKDNFPENYVDYVQSLLGKKEIVLISTHRDILMEIERVGIDYILVYPQEDLKIEYVRRYGESQFSKLLDQKWDLFIKNMSNANPNKRIVLKSGEYLKDKLNFLYL